MGLGLLGGLLRLLLRLVLQQGEPRRASFARRVWNLRLSPLTLLFRREECYRREVHFAFSFLLG